MSRLIDADALREKIQNGEHFSGWGNCIVEIDDAPTVDAEEVVRCKDCKWWDKKDGSTYGYCTACKHGYFSKHWEIGIYRTYKGDWFCADGERM